MGERNEEGKMVLELADATGLVLANTLFKREKRRLITYRSGLNETMVDYMMVRLKDRKMLSNVKVIPGQLQHGLLLMDVIEKEMLKKMKVSTGRSVQTGKIAGKHFVTVHWRQVMRFVGQRQESVNMAKHGGGKRMSELQSTTRRDASKTC